MAVLAVVGVGLGVIALLLPVRTDTGSGPDPTIVTEPPVVPAIPDGEWFGLVTVGEDEVGAVTLGVDLAEMLTGQAAHDAAVEAGVIAEGEDLPNDFFIDNPESVLELMHLDDSAAITVLSGVNVANSLLIDAEQLVDLFEGDYVGPPVYGVLAGHPIAMNLVVTDGVVTSASAIYLP